MNGWGSVYYDYVAIADIGATQDSIVPNDLKCCVVTAFVNDMNRLCNPIIYIFVSKSIFLSICLSISQYVCMLVMLYMCVRLCSCQGVVDNGSFRDFVYPIERHRLVLTLNLSDI